MLFGTNSYIIWLLSFSITHKAEKVEDMEVLKIDHVQSYPKPSKAFNFFFSCSAFSLCNFRLLWFENDNNVYNTQNDQNTENIAITPKRFHEIQYLSKSL